MKIESTTFSIELTVRDERYIGTNDYSKILFPENVTTKLVSIAIRKSR